MSTSRPKKIKINIFKKTLHAARKNIVRGYGFDSLSASSIMDNNRDILKHLLAKILIEHNIVMPRERVGNYTTDHDQRTWGDYYKEMNKIRERNVTYREKIMVKETLIMNYFRIKNFDIDDEKNWTV